MTMRSFINIVEAAMPPAVMDDLQQWTAKWGRTLKPETVAWLQKNAPRPTAPVTLYRGVSIQGSHIGKLAVELMPWDPRKSFEKNVRAREESERQATDILARRYLGIGADELRRGAAVTISRRKPVSWSRNRKWTYEFAAQGVCRVGVIIEAIVPPETILLDFTMLPSDLHQRVSKYHFKDEVLTYGPVTGKIVEVGDFDKLWNKAQKAKP